MTSKLKFDKVNVQIFRIVKFLWENGYFTFLSNKEHNTIVNG